MNRVQDTSRLAYDEIKPELGEKQKSVMAAFERFGSMTNSELAEVLKWPINTVTPRTNELVKLGKLTEWDRRKCKLTKRMAIVWGLAQRETLF